VDSVAWPAPILQHLLGRIPSDSVRTLAAAAEIKGRQQSWVAAFYLGQQALLRGDLATAAASFEETRAGCVKDASEYKGAVAELQRMTTSEGASTP
jgi:lipoprotein NlpI